MKAYLFFITLILFYGCNHYGKERICKGFQIYYTPEITDTELNALENYLDEIGFGDGNPKTVQITKSGNTYEFRMVIKKGIEQDQEYCNAAKAMTVELSSKVFNGGNVDVHFCDDHLQTIRVFPMAFNHINNVNLKQNSEVSNLNEHRYIKAPDTLTNLNFMQEYVGKSFNDFESNEVLNQRLEHLMGKEKLEYMKSIYELSGASELIDGVLYTDGITSLASGRSDETMLAADITKNKLYVGIRVDENTVNSYQEDSIPPKKFNDWLKGIYYRNN